MIKKIYKIAHIHVWDKKNKGDVAIVLAVKQLLRQKLAYKISFTDFPIEALKIYDSAVVKKLNSCDAIIIGGGGIFYHYFLPFDKKTIEKILSPIIIYGTGYIREAGAKKLNYNQADSLLKLAEKANLIGVRDYYTKHFLKKIGVKKNIFLVGDPAIFLEEIKPKSFSPKAGLNIGFNLNYSGWLGFGKWQKEILNAYKITADYFINKYQANIFYLMHHPGEIKIIHKLEIPGMKTIDLTAREQKYFYGRLNLVVGMMLHSCVMAFGAGTPEINLAYDLRNSSFAKFINSPELLIRPEELKKGILLKKAKLIIENESIYRKKFLKIKKRIYREQKKFLEKINNILNE